MGIPDLRRKKDIPDSGLKTKNHFQNEIMIFAFL